MHLLHEYMQLYVVPGQKNFTLSMRIFLRLLIHFLNEFFSNDSIPYRHPILCTPSFKIICALVLGRIFFHLAPVSTDVAVQYRMLLILFE